MNKENIPLTAGLRTGGKRVATMNLLDHIWEKVQESAINPCHCSNCEQDFYIIAGFEDANYGRLQAKEYLNDVNEPKETGFDKFIIITPSQFKELVPVEIPEDSYEWHENLEEL